MSEKKVRDKIIFSKKERRKGGKSVNLLGDSCTTRRVNSFLFVFFLFASLLCQLKLPDDS